MGMLLDGIKGPDDVKRLSSAQLPQLADEIRQKLVETVLVAGGHLASSLGTVELAIALHRVFDSPRDKIIWDVGHQSYPHKLLTGRVESFSSIRQYGGISGFADPRESPHDPCVSGHASTSISAALGIATARDLAHQGDYSVIAVIGDGALGGGLAFEAINHAGQMGRKIIVVLNDNRMAISPTVGAVARWLNRLYFDRRLERAEGKAKSTLGHLPLGEWVYLCARVLKRSVKTVFLPCSIFEELGLAYMGPVDGHNVAQLESALKQARTYTQKPVVLHVLTTKGKGYGAAEADPVYFHGLAGRKKHQSNGLPTFSEVFARSIRDMMSGDGRVVVITAAMTEGNGLAKVAQEFPTRFFDVGICEAHAVTFAAGLASRGFIPVVAIYSTFLQRSFDQLIHDVCLQRLPVVFALDRSGIVGEDGRTHHGLFDLSYLSLMPDLIVSAPRDGAELAKLLRLAVAAGGPMAIRYPRGHAPGDIAPSSQGITIGSGQMLRQGKDVSLVALGSMVAPALSAADSLSLLGIEATVLDARFAKPLDACLIGQAALTTGRVLTIEENVLSGGFGSQVLALLSRVGPGLGTGCVGIPDEFVEQGSQEELRRMCHLDADGIVSEVRRFFPELFNERGCVPVTLETTGQQP